MGINGLFAQHSVKIERKLNDLESRSDSLRRSATTPPMNWHEFQRSEQAASAKPAGLSWGSAVTGVGIGSMAGIGGTLLLNAIGMPPGIGMLGAASIGLVGGGAIGSVIPNEEDKREAKIVAYEEYLDQFEKAQANVPSRRSAMEEEVRSPSVGRLRTPTGNAIL